MDKVVIAIDDVHPEKDWGLETDKVFLDLVRLNKLYGCKFTLFIPSNYHNRFPLSKHKDWVQTLNSFNWLELAAHGHYHISTIDEQEFFRLSEEETLNRFIQMLKEWNAAGVNPVGFRPPGWGLTKYSRNIFKSYFDYLAYHFTEQLDSKIIIPTISANGEKFVGRIVDYISIQSHINGKHNENSLQHHGVMEKLEKYVSQFDRNCFMTFKELHFDRL